MERALRKRRGKMKEREEKSMPRLILRGQAGARGALGRSAGTQRLAAFPSVQRWRAHKRAPGRGVSGQHCGQGNPEGKTGLGG